MTKIGIIICGRYQECGGGKCFRALKERVGGFSRYPKNEEVEIVGCYNKADAGDYKPEDYVYIGEIEEQDQKL